MMLVLVLTMVVAPCLPLTTPSVTCQQGYAPSHTKVGTSAECLTSNVALIL